MSVIRKTIVSNSEKKFLIKCLSEWVRLDNRAFDEFRDVQIEFGKDWGSCYTSLGKTRVLAQVSCELQTPKSSRPSEGILNINIELNPIADPNFEAGRQSDLSVQLNRLLEKCLKDSKAVDLESLCVQVKEKVWALRVDINVLNHEGNILDCSSIAALAALAHFRRPDVTCDGEEFKIHSYKQRDPIPTVIHHYPVCITYSIFNGGDYILADPTLLEERVAEASLTIGLNAYKELCGLHLGGKALLSPDVILSTTTKAGNRAAIVVQLIKDAVQNDNNKRQNLKECGFNKNINLDKVEVPSDILTTNLDQWRGKKKKHKNKKKAIETVIQGVEVNIETENIDVQNMEINIEADGNENKFVAEIEELGKGTVALIPKDNGKNVWSVSESDSEDEVMVVEVPAPKIVTVDIVDSGSEEEAVVVLNADKKTNKKKKKNT